MAEISAKDLKKLAEEFNGEIVNGKEINPWTDVDKVVYKRIKGKNGSK